MTLIQGWATNRPVYHRLPVDCQRYQREPIDENDIIPADVLTDWVDIILMQSKTSVDNLFIDYLEPTTAKSLALDWLAQICGFTDEYWNPTWDDSIKRQLIKDSYKFIWPNRGNTDVLVYLIRLFNIPTYPEFNIYLVPYWLANYTTSPGITGRQSYQFFIRLLNTTIRNDNNWKLSNDFVRLYNPAWVNGVVCFDYWYAGSSAANDGVFDYIYEKTYDIAKNWSNQNPDLSCIELVGYLSSYLNIEVEILKRHTWKANESTTPGMAIDNNITYYIVDDHLLYNTWQWYVVNYLISLYCTFTQSVVCSKYFQAGITSVRQPVFEMSGLLTTQEQGHIIVNNKLLMTETTYEN